MKFIAQKTGPGTVNDGTLVVHFVEGTEYEFDDEHIPALREHGFAPSDEPKEAHPVQGNKMAHPVAENKARPQGNHQKHR